MTRIARLCLPFGYLGNAQNNNSCSLCPPIMNDSMQQLPITWKHYPQIVPKLHSLLALGATADLGSQVAHGQTMLDYY